MSYKEICEFVNSKGFCFPCGGKNESDEYILLDRGKDENGDFVQIKTAQNNNWIKVETYYECGDTTETYER